VPFHLDASLAVLERTPAVLRALLADLPSNWTTSNEGPDTWSPYDVLGHLIHGERTDWMTRLGIILEDGPGRPFTPFDRFAQFRESEGKSLGVLLDDFEAARADNLRRLRALSLTDTDLDRTGTHPSFGTVTARQLLSTWTVHDLDHIVQISRVMAAQLGGDVGPWIKYLRIIRDPLVREPS
jgi:hypothetical protein